VSIFVRNSLKFNQIDIMPLCMEQDIKCCAVQLESKFSKIRVLTKNRALAGDLELYLNTLNCLVNYAQMHVLSYQCLLPVVADG
jgi:hypothetical protein